MNGSTTASGLKRDRRLRLQIEGFSRGKALPMNSVLGWSRGCLLTVTGLLMLGVASVEAQSRPTRSAWTERTVTNPALATQTSIEGSLERFWSLPEGYEVNTERRDRPLPKSRGPELRSASNGVSMEQQRDTRECRGYLGINLFNLIPLIDIVHGVVDEESVDRVEGRK